MDVVTLLDKLENYIAEATRLPLTNKVLIDEEEVYSFIDDIKNAFPEELQQAKWVLKERERLLAEARKEAESIVQSAREQVTRLADDSALTVAARAKAEEYVEKAKSVAQEIRSGALEYADGVLASLENYLVQTLESVKNGRDQLQEPKTLDSSKAAATNL